MIHTNFFSDGIAIRVRYFLPEEDPLIRLFNPGVLNGLRKMVSSSVNTPATVREGKTPVLSKSAAKRKFDSYEGLSAKTK